MKAIFLEIAIGLAGSVLLLGLLVFRETLGILGTLLATALVIASIGMVAALVRRRKER